jgi:hypothetical protein
MDEGRTCFQEMDQAPTRPGSSAPATADLIERLKRGADVLSESPFAMPAAATLMREAARALQELAPEGTIKSASERVGLSQKDDLRSFEGLGEQSPAFNAVQGHQRSHLPPPGVPRRACVYLMSKAELAIMDAKRAVEAAGCDPRLTEALDNLHQAQRLVADVVDEDCAKVTMGRCVAAHMGGSRCIERCMCPRDCTERPLAPLAQTDS